MYTMVNGSSANGGPEESAQPEGNTDPLRPVVDDLAHRRRDAPIQSTSVETATSSPEDSPDLTAYGHRHGWRRAANGAQRPILSHPGPGPLTTPIPPDPASQGSKCT